MRERGIDDQHSCAGMVDDVGDLPRSQTHVDRHEHRARCRDAVVRFQQLGRVGREECDTIVLLDSCLLQADCKTASALAEVRPGPSSLAVHDCDSFRKGGRGALEEGKWRQPREMDWLFHQE